MWGCTHLHSSRRLIHCKQCLPLCATIFFHKLCAGICNGSYSVCVDTLCVVTLPLCAAVLCGFVPFACWRAVRRQMRRL